jgi:hypothetical protein
MVKITNRYQTEQNLRAERIVKRIVRYAPSECLNGLNEIELLDRDTIDNCFASYSRSKRKIELFVGDILGWQPWILRKSYILLYLAIGIALGHELDHHVNRDKRVIDKEKSAENNSLRYIYPSLGIFKPIIKVIPMIAKLFSIVFRDAYRIIS